MVRAFLSPVGTASYLPVVQEGLAHIGGAALLRPDSRVFIKPNLTYPTYMPGVMTTVAAVEATIAAVTDYTPHVTVGDADSGGYNRFSMAQVYGEIGMAEITARYGASLVNLSDLPSRPVDVTGGRRPVSVALPTLLTDETDHLLSIPVPKVHMNTGVSLSFKNQWGCIPQPQDRLRLHPDFARVVLGVNRAIHASIAVVDGRVGLTGSGPLRGDPVDLGWLLVADDLGAADRLCCELMQVPLSAVPHLRLAQRCGMLPARADIALNRDLTPFLREPFTLHRAWTDYPGFLAFRSRTLAYLAYFSPLSSALHTLLYRFREPFYDYASGEAATTGAVLSPDESS